MIVTRNSPSYYYGQGTSMISSVFILSHMVYVYMEYTDYVHIFYTWI